MRDDLLPMLACPVCAEPPRPRRRRPGRLPERSPVRRGEAGPPDPPAREAPRLTADTPEMVDARLRFLGRGHYAPVERALAAIVANATAPGIVLDVGSGPGTYLAHALRAADGRLGVALDLSAVAIRRAARAHERAGAVVGDVTERLPGRRRRCRRPARRLRTPQPDRVRPASCTPTACSWW
ncbi:hypothetical protein Q9Q99_12060 [Curtobacterium flaccumfaciens]|nr:hypothetical protein Q9Q99_12060 [Curtobacterium flaccumfaciens]